MVLTNETYLPTYEELSVPQELDVSWPTMKAAAMHIGMFCDNTCKEFMLCRAETEDPRACLKESKEVTACGVKFFQKVKKHCRTEFEKYLHCVEHKTSEMSYYPCQKLQRAFDICALEKLGIERPLLGHFSRPRIHHSERPEPPLFEKYQQYKEEADKHMGELPRDWQESAGTRNYFNNQAYWDWGFY